jgi:hypothetical protein
MFQILSVGAEVGEVEAGKKVSNQNMFSIDNDYAASSCSLKQH